MIEEGNELANWTNIIFGKFTQKKWWDCSDHSSKQTTSLKILTISKI